MTITDPIADLLARIRNALLARKSFALVPSSKMNQAVLKILQEQGYIADVVEIPLTRGRKTSFKQLKVTLKYVDNQPVIVGLQRVSRPGQRIYLPVNRLQSVLKGTGVAVISTSQGLLADKQARQEGLGGEVLFKVW